MNQFKEKEKETKQSKPGNGKKGKIAQPFIDVINGNFLAKESVVNSLPYIFFLTFIALCYIGNGYYAEDTVRDINNMNNQLKELRSEYLTTKSELMFKSKQSEVASALEPMGIKESVVPPKKIVITVNK